VKNKKRKNPEVAKLQKENWQLCREIVDLRDGHVCQIPECGAREGLQLDHVISRECKTTFYETDILGYLCAAHHTHKSFRKGQWVDLMVRDICVARLGACRWDDLKFYSRGICGDFNKVFYQEQINMQLKEKRAELLQKNNQ
jgi:hypothetical protein